MITALSPLDGRYASKTDPLIPYFSEFALIRYRLFVEIEWLIFLCNILKLDNTRILKEEETKKLRHLYDKFNIKEAEKVKTIEKTTNHDVKAVEYYIKENIKNTSLKNISEFIHFACTSEDINNLAYSLMLKESIGECLLPTVEKIIETLKQQAKQYQSVPMLARTHGQPASPTTMGKELINFVARLERQINNPAGCDFLGKINGAVGNYNAHIVAYPEIDWMKTSQAFVLMIGLTTNLYTTQIEPHDFTAEIFDIFRRINTIMIDLCRDIWTYISLDYFKQTVKKGEVGSSTMPHKVNPIDFENAEGNFGLANALFGHLSEKLPISRMQRDLTDSTVFRNIGSAFGYSLIAYQSLLKGLGKLKINANKMKEDLNDNWEILAEPIQTVLRKNKVPNAYEKLKELTRSHKISAKELKAFVKKLNIPKKDKEILEKLTPEKYIGLAEKLVKNYK